MNVFTRETCIREYVIVSIGQYAQFPEPLYHLWNDYQMTTTGHSA
jgi:hypothetical protein